MEGLKGDKSSCNCTGFSYLKNTQKILFVNFSSTFHAEKIFPPAPADGGFCCAGADRMGAWMGVFFPSARKR